MSLYGQLMHNALVAYEECLGWLEVVVGGYRVFRGVYRVFRCV